MVSILVKMQANYGNIIIKVGWLENILMEETKTLLNFIGLVI